ncbi:MAG: molybdopterin dinucleotide binding domain-containing protein, partial [Saezia sp.]
SVSALSKLKYLVVIDPMETETADFWKNFGEFSPQTPENIDTEVFQLPSSLFAEEDGSITNSGRWLQWHWAAANPPGEGKTDSAIIAEMFLKVRELYAKEGGTCAEQVLNLAWNYSQPHHPGSDEVAKEMNGRALVDITDANGNVILKKGQLLSSFAQMRDDGTTSGGCWIYTGCWTEAGNMMARRDPADPSGLGNTLGWSWAWPANRRILYNRASMDRNGKPWDPERATLRWNGSAWSGYDIPDFGAIAPGSDTNPFIMQADGVGGLFSLGKNTDGPFPVHYEPMESPLDKHPLYEKVKSSPTVRVLKNDSTFGTKDKFPYVATTYRLTEHFHSLTKYTKLGAITQPEAFAEISETLAAKIGVKAGDTIKVSSLRGFTKVKAVVTKRIKTFKINDQDVEVVGIPIHWGYKGEARPAHPVNNLTPSVGDSNTFTPEFKAFLVNVEKA